MMRHPPPRQNRRRLALRYVVLYAVCGCALVTSYQQLQRVSMPVTVPCQVILIFLSLTLSKLIISKYRTGKTLGSGTYAIVKEAIHVETGKYFACKVINKKLMEGREHMVSPFF